MLFQTTGILRHGRKDWWLVADCDINIVKYYGYLFYKRYGRHLNLPKYGSHITIIQREEPIRNKEHWGTFDSESVLIDINSIYTIGDEKKFFCFDVSSERLMELREFFGLKKQHPFHMTIGWEKGNKNEN